jgi:hypothetical protein
MLHRAGKAGPIQITLGPNRHKGDPTLHGTFRMGLSLSTRRLWVIQSSDHVFVKDDPIGELWVWWQP